VPNKVLLFKTLRETNHLSDISKIAEFIKKWTVGMENAKRMSPWAIIAVAELPTTDVEEMLDVG